METKKQIYIKIAIGAALSLLIAASVVTRKGELHSRYYTVFMNDECEICVNTFMKYENSNPNPVYEKFLEMSPPYVMGAIHYASKLPGMNFRRASAAFMLWVHFVFSFGLFCIVLGLFRTPALAYAAAFLAYGLEPYSQVYSYHPWVPSMYVATLPLIFASFGFLILNLRIASMATLLLSAVFQPLWFLTALPIYILLFFTGAPAGENTKFHALKKAIPALLVIYPVALAVIINFRLESIAGFSNADMGVYWNLAAARGNHNIFFGNAKYFLLLRYAAMLAACPLLTRLPSSKRIPALSALTKGTLFISIGFLAAQIAGNELRLMIAANGMTPLRIESLLFFVMLLHLMAGAADNNSPLNARIFALLMFIATALSWCPLFNYFPICMPLWALLQTRFFYSGSAGSKLNIAAIAACPAAIAVLTSNKIMPSSVLPPMHGIFMTLRSVHLAIPIPLYINICCATLIFAYILIALLTSKGRIPPRNATHSRAFVLIVFLLGAWGVYKPHYSELANLKPLNPFSEISLFLKNEPPGPAEWGRAVSWINSNIKQNEAILIHPDFPLFWLVSRKTNLDHTMMSAFFYNPLLLHSINDELINIYHIRAENGFSSSLLDEMRQAWQGARIRTYFSRSPKDSAFRWIAEPPSSPPFVYLANGSKVSIKPDFENDAIRIYRIPAAGVHYNNSHK